MQRLTFSNHAELKRLVDTLQVSMPAVADAQLVLSVSDYVSERARGLGFELPLTRDAVSLCYYLIAGEDEKCRSIARASLQYLLRQDDLIGDAIPNSGLQDDFCVLQSAVREVAAQTGNPLGIGGIGLTAKHRAEIEQRVAAFREAHVLEDDGSLITLCRAMCDRLESQDPAGVFQRMRRHAHQLIRTVELGLDEAGWSRAALRYLLEADDVVADHRGLVGMLDDEYAVEYSLGRTEPAATMLRPALDKVIHRWPFINWLVLNDGGVRITLSEFALLNAGLLQSLMAEQTGPRSLAVFTPVRGPISFLAGFLAAVGAVSDQTHVNSSSGGFREGDKVFVDSRETVRIFGGIRDIPDRGACFCLIKIKTHRGRPLEERMWWPATPAFYSRLTAAPSGSATRGEIRTNLARSDAPIRAIDRAVASSVPVHFNGDAPQVVLVGQVGDMRAWADDLTLFGEKLRDVLPMGHVDQYGGVKHWSPQWSAVKPRILIAPHPSIAAELLDSAPAEATQPVFVVDGSASLSRHAAMRRLIGPQNRTLIVADESDEECCDALMATGIPIARWSRHGLGELIWNAGAPESRIRSFERRVEIAGTSIVRSLTVACPEASDAYAVLMALSDAADEREHAPAPLVEIVGLAWTAMVILFETVVPLGVMPERSHRVHELIGRCRSGMNASAYLSDRERSLTAQVVDALEVLSRRLLDSNPKWSELKSVMSTHDDLAIVVRGSARTTEYEAAIRAANGSADRVRLTLMDVHRARQGSELPLVISGWLNARNMARLLYPPASRALDLLLYPPEAQSFEAFGAKRRAREGAAAVRTPVQIVRGAEGPARQRDDNAAGQIVANDGLEALQAKMAAHRRMAIVEAARPSAFDPEMRARLATFSDGSYAFLTLGYRAKVVSHLVNSTSTEALETPEIAIVDREEIRQGDFLLFQKGSDADAIRLGADRLLGSQHSRLKARLWHDALLRAQSAASLDDHAFAHYLRSCGLPRQVGTIQVWLHDLDLIAPRAYEDVDLIASITGDSVLGRRLLECKTAISEVRGAHLRASQALAVEVIRAFAHLTRAGRTIEALQVAVGDSAIVVQVAALDETDVSVRRSLCNRVLEGFDDGADVA